MCQISNNGFINDIQKKKSDQATQFVYCIQVKRIRSDLGKIVHVKSKHSIRINSLVFSIQQSLQKSKSTRYFPHDRRLFFLIVLMASS